MFSFNMRKLIHFVHSQQLSTLLMPQKRRRKIRIRKETKQVLLGSAIFFMLAMIMVLLILGGVFS